MIDAQYRLILKRIVRKAEGYVHSDEETSRLEEWVKDIARHAPCLVENIINWGWSITLMRLLKFVVYLASL